jgi:hypothetical protein
VLNQNSPWQVPVIARRHLYISLVVCGTLCGVAPARAPAQTLSAEVIGGGEWVSRASPLEFKLSRPLQGNEHLALLVGTADVTGLCLYHGDTLGYYPVTVLLPAGSISVALYLVGEDGVWVQAGGFTMNVLTATGLETGHITPSVTLSEKGVLADEQFPGTEVEGQGKFQELNGQLGLNVSAERGGVTLGAGLNVVASSLRREALRFGEKGNDASKIDLASYLVEARVGRTMISVGSISHGRERHLLSGFASRGVSVVTAIGSIIDVSGAVMNGTGIVGWDNFLGLQNPQHRLYGGTLGVEILPGAPGTVRVEASYVHGSQLPFNGFNSGRIADAEESNGRSVRLLLANPARSITLDAGLARTRFTNPVDPLLSQGTDIVPVEATTSQARYADLTWDVLRDVSFLEGTPARLVLGVRHERVDPLYRAVGASVRADFLSNTYEFHGGLGPAQLDVTHMESEDNLADIPSVLKSKTRQTLGNVLLVPASSRFLPSWLPSLSYGFQSTHQFGVSIPTNSQFTAERVPDQVTMSHTAGCDWQASDLRVTYRGAITTQDNRQVGRENADAVTRVHGLTVAFSPLARLSLNIEGAVESNENVATGSVLRLRRLGAGVNATLFPGANATANATLSATAPDDGSTSQNLASFTVETSYAFDFSRSLLFAWRGQLFVRYSWNQFILRDDLLLMRTANRAWAIHTGASMTLF